VPPGPLTVVPGRPEDTLCLEDGRLYGTAHRVPWARSAEWIVALLQDEGAWNIVAVKPEAGRLTPMTDLAGEPRDMVSFEGATPEVAALSAATARTLLFEGALTRAVLMAGALQRVCELTVAYTGERVQFGRPIARFQAVQQQVVPGRGGTAGGGLPRPAAARAAGRGAARFGPAAARRLANRAVHTPVRAANRGQGAMGVTQEYPLHHATRRL